jgi:UDP:flavonoid glycosyltransferase YjiC (YdhE family)
MAKVLAYNTPAMGHLFPTSVLLTELRDRGHDIALRTLRTGVPLGQELGFATAAVDPRIEAMPLNDWDATSPEDALRCALGTFGHRAEYEVDDMRQAIQEVAPDVLIIDANCWGAAATAEASGLPWLSFWAYSRICDQMRHPRTGRD